ncbi:MAG: TIGR01244 family sulfur transferase [Paracoccaceae bacterium]
MDIRPLTPDYAVSPQIDPEDFAAIKAAGYTRVINNRPDGEIPPSHHAKAMQAAAEAAGLEFVVNPVISGALTMANVTAQAEAIASATGPVLAYCASGNRSSICWALAKAGEMPTDDLVAIPARHGYNLEGLRPQIDMLAKG